MGLMRDTLVGGSKVRVPPAIDLLTRQRGWFAAACCCDYACR